MPTPAWLQLVCSDNLPDLSIYNFTSIHPMKSREGTMCHQKCSLKVSKWKKDTQHSQVYYHTSSNLSISVIQQVHLQDFIILVFPYISPLHIVGARLTQQIHCRFVSLQLLLGVPKHNMLDGTWILQEIWGVLAVYGWNPVTLTLFSSSL